MEIRLKSARETIDATWVPCMERFRVVPSEDDGWFTLERRVDGYWDLVDEFPTVDEAKLGAAEAAEENLKELRAVAAKLRRKLARIDAHLEATNQ